MSGKAVASSVALVLGFMFLLPFWEAAASENDDVIMIMFGFGFFLPVAILVILAVLALTTMAYSMHPFHRGSLWTAVAALGLGGILAALLHAVLALQARSSSRASGQPNLYEDSYGGFWLAAVSAVVLGITLWIVAPRTPRTGKSHQGPPPGVKPRPPGSLR